MDFELVWAHRASADLEDIVKFYKIEQQSESVAVKVGSAIIDRVEILRSFPDIGPLYPRYVGPHREIFCYKYRIFYRVDRDQAKVFVARIWHGRMDLDALQL
jgi:plasmid stabilization system protein ParE